MELSFLVASVSVYLCDLGTNDYFLDRIGGRPGTPRDTLLTVPKKCVFLTKSTFQLIWSTTGEGAKRLPDATSYTFTND